MFKKNIKIITVIGAFLAIPLFTFAGMEGMNDNMTYFEMHWSDITALALVLVSIGYALLAAKIYGGIVGVALKFTSIGLVIVVLYRTLNSFEHLGVNILSKNTGTILELIGFTLIAIGMYKMYTETKKNNF